VVAQVAQRENVVGRIGFRASRPAGETAVERAHVRRLVARAKTGDRNALRDLYARYADSVYGYVNSIVRDHHEAEDITQQVFAKLIGAIVKYDERGIPFSGWLLRLARNLAIDHVRARRSLPFESPLANITGGREAESEHVACLRSALGMLPEEQRTVIVLRHLAGLTPAEIATRIGRSESAVHGLHHRARQTMREELRRLGAAPATLRVLRAA
jgi:RNA polymerase sigma-70 factor (ECF subfamily)